MTGPDESCLYSSAPSYMLKDYSPFDEIWCFMDQLRIAFPLMYIVIN